MWATHAITWSMDETFGIATAPVGNTVGIIGGSQMHGANTGQYGSLAAPYATKPATITVIVNGITLSSYNAVMGHEPGLAYALSQAGKTATIIGRYVDATTASDWVNTHFATFVTDCTNAGKTPKVIFYAIGGQDCLTAVTIDALWKSLHQLAGLIEKNFPGCAFCIYGLMATDLTAFPKQVEGRAMGRTFCENRAGHRLYMDPTGIPLQTDITHPTAVGFNTCGERDGYACLTNGLII